MLSTHINRRQFNHTERPHLFTIYMFAVGLRQLTLACLVVYFVLFVHSSVQLLVLNCTLFSMLCSAFASVVFTLLRVFVFDATTCWRIKIYYIYNEI